MKKRLLSFNKSSISNGLAFGTTSSFLVFVIFITFKWGLPLFKLAPGLCLPLTALVALTLTVLFYSLKSQLKPHIQLNVIPAFIIFFTLLPVLAVFTFSFSPNTSTVFSKRHNELTRPQWKYTEKLLGLKLYKKSWDVKLLSETQRVQSFLIVQQKVSKEATLLVSPALKEERSLASDKKNGSWCDKYSCYKVIGKDKRYFYGYLKKKISVY